MGNKRIALAATINQAINPQKYLSTLFILLVCFILK